MNASVYRVRSRFVCVYPGNIEFVVTLWDILGNIYTCLHAQWEVPCTFYNWYDQM